MKQKAVIHDHAAASIAEVEQAALDRGIKADIGLRDTELECAKYRRVMQLEKQLEQTQDVLKQREQHLKSCENALIEANEKITKREAWIERLQKQLDYSNQKINELYAAYNQRVDDEREMLAQIDTLFVERENAETKHDQQIMRLRVRWFALVCAIVLLIVSGLVVWGVA